MILLLLEAGAIIWPKKKTFHLKFSPILVRFPIVMDRQMDRNLERDVADHRSQIGSYNCLIVP